MTANYYYFGIPNEAENAAVAAECARIGWLSTSVICLLLRDACIPFVARCERLTPLSQVTLLASFLREVKGDLAHDRASPPGPTALPQPSYLPLPASK